MTSAGRKWGWGLIGPGRFAREFCQELQHTGRAHLAAVASRSAERSQAFAEEFGFAKAYDDYAKLIADPSVDIVYVVLPHSFHREVAEMALRSGKAVVCEKPLTPSFSDSRSLIELAESRSLFLTEAMKTAFLPAVLKARDWIREGAIGEPTLVKADFGFLGSNDPEDRLLNPKLGGGCLLDVGIYPLFLARFLVGEIDRLEAVGSLAETGVEETVTLSVHHVSGACSALTASFRTPDTMDALVLGTEGQILLPKFHAATEAILTDRSGGEERYVSPDAGMVRPEIEAIMDALDAGHKECANYTHRDTLALARWIEQASGQVRSKA